MRDLSRRLEERAGNLAPDSDSLYGLPPVLSRGLIPVTVLAGISLVSCTALFLHLTYKLVRWHMRARGPASRRQRRLASHQSVDFALGLSARNFGLKRPRRHDSDVEEGQVSAPEAPPRPQPNQFVLLIYNLMLAEVHQGLAFFFSAVWMVEDAVLVHTGTCFAQGWFISTGDLAASLCVTNIAIHNYCIIALGWKPPQWAIIVANAMVWVIDYGMAIIGLWATRNGQAVGGFYVRVGAWCWINTKYQTLRLVIHYLYMFLSILVTTILYVLIFYSLRDRNASSDTSTRTLHRRGGSSADVSLNRGRDRRGRRTIADALNQAEARQAQESIRTKGRRHAFLLYPIIYMACTLPLAVGRIATMAGIKVPLSVFCIVGSLISSNGWLDVVLWGYTRRSVLFGDVGAADDLGIQTFSFMRTPADRQWGNMVWVEGAGSKRASREQPLQQQLNSFNLLQSGGRRVTFSNGHGGVVIDTRDGRPGRATRLGRSARRMLGLRCPRDGKEAGPRRVRRGWWRYWPREEDESASLPSDEEFRMGLRGQGRLAIQMERVTEVLVEVNRDVKAGDVARERRDQSAESETTNDDYENVVLPPML